MDRLLMFVGLGAMGLLAQVFGGNKEGARWVPQRAAWRRPARVFAGVLVAIHVVVAPLLFLLILQMPKLMGHESSSLPDTFPNDQALSRQTVVVVNPISLPTEWLLIHLQDFHHRPLPQRTLHLASSCSTASLTRTDDRTLEVRVQGGYLAPRGQWPGRMRPPAISVIYVARFADRFVRGDRNPLKLGQTIQLTAATVEITELTPDGRAAEARFRFPVPLEDPSLRWLQVTQQGYRPFHPPEVGETVKVDIFRQDLDSLSSHKAKTRSST